MATQNERRELKKQQIIEIMLKYKDENGNIDVTRLRKEDKNTYNKLSYYFESIDHAVYEAGASTSGGERDNSKGAPVNRKTLRNELAYDMLVELRSKYTLEEIANRYGCSRAHVNQLYQALNKTVGASRDIMKDVIAE